ncbi:conserved hypothetical protein [Chlorobaculum parvum NCIB 8327]|uniref:Uncharacterized protein n=1 Tax=Chlorobaculum parvum (strain DSM 263 / NCIMB 8327) TaxID=517417 RepID=B3QML6_CHLP8|nr:hypothetical protein [Chlorobaculum parvum]ACF11169.1 conserved hypothetical protein [Chlorobaculum parvum NCIB 8327]
MKEVSRKFSEDSDEPQGSSERSIPQPVRQHGPASHDVRFVVKESLNLGFRFLNDVELFLKKMQPEEPQKGEQPENEPEKKE